MSASEKARVNMKEEEGGHASVAYGTILQDDIDNAVLRANGHRSELKRQFNWLSALALGFSITNSWAGYLVSVRCQSYRY